MISSSIVDQQASAVPADYYQRERPDLLKLIPRGKRRILDVGCGEGAMANRVKQMKGVEEVVGLEKNEEAAAVARKFLDRVIAGDLEELSLDFPDGYFDCIICADVLEHLRDPWSCLLELRRVLSDDGILFACIPNIRNTIPLLKILFNRWEYQEEGLLDRTHLRFFTLHTMQKMFDDTGYVAEIVGRNYWRGRFYLVHLFSLGLLRPFSIYQYVFYARKKRGSAR